MNHPHDVIFRAIDFLRAEPQPGWDAIAARVVDAIRVNPRPGGRPLLAQTPPDQPGQGNIYVSDHVLRSAIAVVLRERYLCSPTGIEFDADGVELRAVHIDVTGSYGTELGELAAEIRATTNEIITELLGASTSPRGPIDITITDVVTGDPLDY